MRYYYETLQSGLIPCKLLRRDGDRAWIKLRRHRGPWRAGEELQVPAGHVVLVVRPSSKTNPFPLVRTVPADQYPAQEQ